MKYTPWIQPRIQMKRLWFVFICENMKLGNKITFAVIWKFIANYFVICYFRFVCIWHWRLESYWTLIVLHNFKFPLKCVWSRGKVEPPGVELWYTHHFIFNMNNVNLPVVIECYCLECYTLGENRVCHFFFLNNQLIKMVTQKMS